MSELYAGAILCGAVAIGSGLLCLMGQAMKPKRINRLLTCIDRRIQGKSARPAGTESDAVENYTTKTYQIKQDLSREGL